MMSLRMLRFYPDFGDLWNFAGNSSVPVYTPTANEIYYDFGQAYESASKGLSLFIKS